ncbi:DNA-protecting protein DprA [Aquincola sp. S2]|uniref:DNA-protecting protein DprA n=2 Tax=Pseudaquabacterium terrae TaxID=2732868 RepID=A0ABX2ECK8_9BURK|nr:DNA-protecting protein DprA [Aquabacterium terrae]
MRRLLAALGSPQAVAAATPAALADVIGPARAQALNEPPDDHAKRLAATRAWLDAAPDRRRVLTLADADYPPLLLQAADPPLLLYLEGRHALLATSSVAIVGSRKPTPQGLDNARRLARQLGEHGWTVVSGLAKGIDGAAHLGALDAGAGTVAVVGTGLEQVYPLAHRALAARIAEDGLLVSEFPIGMPLQPDNFPQRNRIIAGLTRGTLVVEAALKSGSLITARLAAEAGREVFAIPGSIQSPQARGCHALLRDGAKLVESVDDVLEELGNEARPAAHDPAPAQPAADDTPDDQVLGALGHDPATLDALIARCGWPAPALNARLMELELEGRVMRLPGGLFQRRGAA